MSENNEEFYYTKAPKSAQAQTSLHPGGRTVPIVKSLLQRYIQRWLEPDSTHKALLQMHAPNAAKFILGRASIPINSEFSWDTSEPGQRPVQVARIFKKLGKKLPAVLIIDGGFRNRVAGLGDLQAGRNMQDERIIHYDIVTSAVVSVEVMVAAGDEDTCSELAIVLSQILGSPLRRFGGGNLITSSDENAGYQMSFPLENSFSATSRENMEGDTVDTSWSSSCSLELDFESVTTLPTGMPLRMGSTKIGALGGSSGVLVPAAPLSEAIPTLYGPTAVSVGKTYTYRVLGPDGGLVVIPERWKLAVSDHTRAIVQTRNNGHYILIPQQRGQMTLKLLDGDRKVQASLEVVIQ